MICLIIRYSLTRRSRIQIPFETLTYYYLKYLKVILSNLVLCYIVNRFSSKFLEPLGKSNDATSNVGPDANGYVKAEANVENVDFVGIHDVDWASAGNASDNEVSRRTHSSMLREYQQSLKHGAESLAASSSSPKSAASYLSASKRRLASCEDLCKAHVRQCVRLCCGFSTQLRGLCFLHCKARARACPHECAGIRETSTAKY